MSLLILALFGNARAEEIFVSVDADGSTRYATQALDSTYQPAQLKAESPRSRRPPGYATARATAMRPLIERVARKHGVSPALVEAIVLIESSFDAEAVSPKGALGAMQLMPDTAARYGLVKPGAWNEPERNIDAGVRHIKYLLSKYRGNVVLTLAAYNAGAGAVARHRGRIPPYRETMIYVAAVLARMAPTPTP